MESDPKVLMKPGSGTLVIDISGGKAEAYEGTYQCTAENEHGKALTNKIVIRQSSETLYKPQGFLTFFKAKQNTTLRTSNKILKVPIGENSTLPPTGLQPFTPPI